MFNTSRNKSKLPYLSKPGVYMVECNCGKKYVGEIKLKVQSFVAFVNAKRLLLKKNGRLPVFLFMQKTVNQDSNGKILGT